MGRAARVSDHRRREQPMECPMPQRDDLSRSLVPFEQDGTLVAVVELSRSSWLVAGIVPGIGRHPLKKLDPSEEALLALLRRWRDEAAGAGCTVTRVAVAFEAGRDGFWLARWLQARGGEAQVIHPTSVAGPRGPRRAKAGRRDPAPRAPKEGPPGPGLATRPFPRGVARGAGPLQHGRDPDPGAGGRQTPEPRA